MTAWDFVVVSLDDKTADGYTLTVEKRPLEGADTPTLDAWLAAERVPDATIGTAIEALEALPYGAGSYDVQGASGTITIKQLKV